MALVETDFVVVATTQTDPMIGRRILGQAAQLRGNRPLTIFDLSTPPNIEPSSVTDLVRIQVSQDRSRKDRAARCQATYSIDAATAAILQYPHGR